MSEHNRAHNKKYVILAGGLTGGPIKPLMAIYKEWQKHDPTISAVIVDTRKSFASRLAVKEGLPFHQVVSGKLRRYFSTRNLFVPILFLIGLIQSLLLIRKYKPVAVIGAGGFVQVPVIIAAWIARVPRLIHQQDVTVTFSNLLSAPFANIITTTFESSIKDFPQGTGLGKKYISTNKVFWTGNPIDIPKPTLDKPALLKKYGFSTELPVLLVYGGGSGAVFFNKLILNSLPEITKVVQVLLSTGKGRSSGALNTKHSGFYVEEDLPNMGDAYLVSDLVMARAGISAITELAELQKLSIIVPMPDSHQETNAALLYKNQAAAVLDQNELTAEVLISVIRKLLFNHELSQQMTNNLHNLFPKHPAENIYKHLHKLTDGK